MQSNLRRVKIRTSRTSKKKYHLQFTKPVTLDPRFTRSILKSLAAETMEKMFTAMAKKAKETCAFTSFQTKWEPTTSPPLWRFKSLNGMNYSTNIQFGMISRTSKSKT